jgi:hypothetical protein
MNNHRSETWTKCPRGDLNPETGEISLIMDLNSKTGEESPDRGFHAAMVAGAPGLASTRGRRLAVYQGAAGPAVSQAEPGTYLLSALWPGNGYPRVPNRAGKLAESWDGDERGNVARPDGGEVPEVHRRDGNDPWPLADGGHRGVRAAEPEVGVLAHEA